MLEALKEKVRVLGEKMKGLKEKVKAAAGKAVDKLNKRAKEFFVSVGKKVKKVGKKAWAMRKEMSAVLILAICAPFGVVLLGLIVTWQHFGFLFWPCTATCKCLISCACKGLLFCCKGGCRGLSSCCKGGSSEDSEAQIQPEAETKKKKPEAEMKEKKPEAEMKKTSCCKSLSSCCKGGSTEDYEAQNRPGTEMRKTSCCYKGLVFCCKCLASCCKGGASEDSEAQSQTEAEMKKTPEQGWNRVLVSLISWPGQLLSLNPCRRPKILARMLFWGFCL